MYDAKLRKEMPMPAGYRDSAIRHTLLAALFALTSSACETRTLATAEDEDDTIATIELLPASASIVVGEVIQLSATAKNKAGRSVNETLDWSTSNPGVAALAGGGQVVGVGQGSATISARSGAVTAHAALTVTGQPQIQLSSSDIRFDAVAGQSNPNSQVVVVTEANGGSLTGLFLGPIQYSAGTSGWLNAAIDQSVGPAVITLNAFTGGVGAGTYTASLQVLSSAASNSPRTLTVTLVITQAPPTSYVLGVVGAGQGSGSITGAGINCTTVSGTLTGTCQATVAAGATVTLTATPIGNSAFSGWSGPCSGTAACTFTMSGSRNVTASFSQQATTLRTLTIDGNGDGAGTVFGNGLDCTIKAGISSGTCETTLPHGTGVSLTAGPEVGSGFLGWSGACTGNGTCMLTLDSDKSVRARFQARYTLSVVGGGSGSGTITGDGINCTITAGSPSGTCQVTVYSGTSIDLTATPTGGANFSGWSGACSGGSCTVVVDADKSVTATFTSPGYTLTVIGAGDGTGTVTGNGLNCTITAGSGTCQISAPAGTSISLNASASAGSVFTSWSGACSGAACSFTLNGDATVTATFSRTFTLTVNGAGNGNGTVTGGGINCTITAASPAGTCQVTVTSGTMITLAAAEQAAHSFGGWSGACSGPNCTVTMDADKSVTATFTAPTFTLSVGVTARWLFSAGVYSDDGQITCQQTWVDTTVGWSSSGPCSATYTSGTTVILTASSSAGNTVIWTGCPTIDPADPNKCIVQMNQNHSISADGS